jgi:methanogenic corrinoid protein MtbC1
MNSRPRRTPDPDPPADATARLSIGALSRASGVSIETLRAWELRYGFPVAERKPSGHRVYPVSTVARLRRVSEAIAVGHRAGQVVAASDADLDVLLAASAPPGEAPSAPSVPSAITTADLLEYVSAFDTERLTAALLAEWARLGPIGFLTTCVAPLIHEAGRSWADGRLEIRHEHFLSERIGDLLRSLRLAFDSRADGPRVVLATLPGESHALGLQMAALVMAVSGLRVSYLGTEVPVPQVAAVARTLDAKAIAISLSSAADASAVSRQVAQLARLAPRGAALLLGGTGATVVRRAKLVISDLGELHRWSRHLAGGAHVIPSTS